MSFSSGVVGTLIPYVTSIYKEHSLTATTTIMSSLVSALIKLPYAKLMDIWGRPQAYGVMIVLMTLGLVLMAACDGVAMYCAAMVFYRVGYNGVDFTMTIFIADTSQLKNRAFWLAFTASPYIATTWAVGPAVTSILNHTGLPWGFGIFCIVNFVICIPLFCLFYYNQWKAIRMGLVPKKSSNRTFWQSMIYYVKEFDIVGLLLVAGGLSLFLLAFNLYTKQPEQWRSPLIICFLIFGPLLLVAFVLYERYLAPITFIKWPLLKNRTVMFTYAMVASIYTSWYLWDNYFYSMLVVVFNQTVTHATYIQNIYTVGSCFWAVVVGIVIRYNGRLKWHAVYFGAPLSLLGVGLMIKFREPDVNIGYIIMCQIFIAFGGGTLVICEQMTLMAVGSQADIPALIAMESMVVNIGNAIGSTIAAALWMDLFPAKLKKYLPVDALANFASIYGDINVQASYPKGSAARTAIDRSYSEAQRIMLITSTCLHVTTIFTTLFWEDVNVKEIKQVKGRVF